MDPEWHDAPLLSIGYEWASASVVVKVRTAEGERQLRVREVARPEIPQLRPWGPSTSVNSDRSTPRDSAGTRLEIEMRSGDVLVIESGLAEHELRAFP
jgi:hypothetical protein